MDEKATPWVHKNEIETSEGRRIIYVTQNLYSSH